LNNFIGEVTST